MAGLAGSLNTELPAKSDFLSPQALAGATGLMAT
jgi:hypothetical protein